MGAPGPGRWSDGATALLLDPLELLERVAALVPPPRRPWLAYHGVLASRARWRAALVRAPREDTRTGGPEDPRGPGRLPWARRLRRVFAIAMLLCPRGGGPRRILRAVTAPAAVRRLLAALGLAAQPPPARPVTAS